MHRGRKSRGGKAASRRGYRHGNAISDGTAKEFINWLKTEGYKFPVIAIVDNLNADAVDVMRGGEAVDVVQRLALDKQLIETVEKYAKPEHVVLTLGNLLFTASHPQ